MFVKFVVEIWRICLMGGLLGLACGAAFAEDEDESPFHLKPSVEQSEGKATLRIKFDFPAGHYVYAEKLHFTDMARQAELSFTVPSPTQITDKHSRSSKLVHASSFVVERPLGLSSSEVLSLRVQWQGCSEEACFLPESREWLVRGDGVVTEASVGEVAAGTPGPQRANTNDWTVVSRSTGFVDTQSFLTWLDRSAKGQEPTGGLLKVPGGFWSSLMTVGLILLGGLGLNLTPCVLPLIPINLAILGAGSAASNRSRGFLLGTLYGTGMALTYGFLGLTVVISGAKFGSLNASPWFNFGIALVFALLSLAMFDKWALDFSGWQSRLGRTDRARRGSLVAAVFMGAVAAALAGACVAPVLISVLLLSTTLHSEGNWLGLLLPFVLGIGMALPWPLAGGGLSFLPKPGNWMIRVKQAFGVLILVFAGYYAVLGWTLLPARGSFGASGQTESNQRLVEEFRHQLSQAQQQPQPIFLKFGASWCKNCTAMEHTTLTDPQVQERLRKFSVVKFAAEHPSDPAVKRVLDEFGVLGLPTFLILSTNQPSVRTAGVAPASTHGSWVTHHQPR